MQFFAKTGERLYPVGRLDYLSEGLLLVTNDGELANKLTRAASGVEKTYVVKVSGQPDEEQIERLRTGIAIDRGAAGKSDKVHTAAARIREIRQGDNPWYEVVLIEGRNRELRKMFEEIGHHVEKIRRVGYGPLVLDVEPGKIRELDAAEVQALRLTADGKLKPRRPKASHMLPKDAGKPAEERSAKPRRFERKPSRPEGAKRAFEPKGQGGPKRPDSKFGDRSKFGARPSGRFDKGARPGEARVFRPAGDRTKDARPFRPVGDQPSSARPFRPAGERASGPRPFRPASDRRKDAKPFRPAGEPATGAGRDRFDPSKKERGPRREDFRQRSASAEGPGGDAPRAFEPRRPQRGEGFRDRPKPFGRGPNRPNQDRPRSDRPYGDRPRPSRPNQDRPSRDRVGPARERPGADRKEFRGAQRPAGGPSPRRDSPPRPFSGPPKRGPAGSSFRGDKRSAGGTASRGTKSGSSFPRASKPAFGSKPGGAKRSQPSFGGKRPSARPGGGAKRPPSRPGGKRAPGSGGKRGPSRPGGKRPK
jgi:pseudouridine synthase